MHFESMSGRRQGNQQEDDIEKSINRILAQKGVTGLAVFNRDGIPIRSTLRNSLSVKFGALITPFVEQYADIIHDMEPDNEVISVRLRTKKYEIFICPDADYVMIVLQKLS